MKSLITFLVIPVLLFATGIQAQAIEKLDFMLGEWALESKYLNNEDEWIDNPPGKAVFTRILDDKGIQEDAEFYFQGILYKTITLIGYDKGRDIFRFSILDHKHGFLDIHQGNFKEEVLEISNEHTGSSFLLDGVEYIYKSRYRSLGKDGFVMSIYLSTDSGSSWKHINQTTYRSANK